MGAGIGWLIQVDDSVFEILFKGTLKRSGSKRNRGVMSAEDIHLIIIFQ